MGVVELELRECAFQDMVLNGWFFFCLFFHRFPLSRTQVAEKNRHTINCLDG